MSATRPSSSERVRSHRALASATMLSLVPVNSGGGWGGFWYLAMVRASPGTEGKMVEYDSSGGGGGGSDEGSTQRALRLLLQRRRPGLEVAKEGREAGTEAVGGGQGDGQEVEEEDGEEEHEEGLPWADGGAGRGGGQSERGHRERIDGIGAEDKSGLHVRQTARLAWQSEMACKATPKRTAYSASGWGLQWGVDAAPADAG
ncbi:hypothetical protein VTK73DRAFT_1846 [Phialemonium thermophilum]|uniref:Uncharacterized protein n=1 Tax=Phialemonium thermophilum TaxID=223376 RepID=A0ABR3VSV9_9PEZI